MTTVHDLSFAPQWNRPFGEGTGGSNLFLWWTQSLFILSQRLLTWWHTSLYYRHSNIILWLLVVISTHSSITGFIKGPNPLPWTCLLLLNFKDNFLHFFNSWGWAMLMVSTQWLSAALKWKLCALSHTLSVCKEINAMDYQAIPCSLVSLGHYPHPPC